MNGPPKSWPDGETVITRARSKAHEALPPVCRDVATWELLEPDTVNPTSQHLLIGVTRLGCAGGETGEVLEPRVAYEDDRVVIRTDVAQLPPGGYSCPGNDTVPVEIELDESLGGRDLVDAACLEGPAVGTAACPSAPRWSSPARGATDEVPDWTAPADHSFTVHSWCGERSLIGGDEVSVRSGAVAEVTAHDDGWAGITPDQVPTISQMLQEARAAAAADGGRVEVAVDGAGVPRWVFADPVEHGVDDETCYVISGYREG